MDYFDLTEQCEKSRVSRCVMLACKHPDARLFSYGEAAKRDEAKRNRAWALLIVTHKNFYLSLFALIFFTTGTRAKARITTTIIIAIGLVKK